MKLTKIELKDESPSKITVEMDIDEAIWIAVVAGKQRGRDPVHNEIYNCLTGLLFNRFWDDGINEVERRAEIPPIIYDKEA